MSLQEAKESAILEFAQINGLIEAAGPDGAREILEAFWRSTADLMNELNSQVSGDLEAASKTAHAIKGSASNVGAARIAACARVAEEACRSNDASEAATAAEALASSMDATRSAFEEHFKAA
ncbi:MAG: Hpt domain-containing protein [Pseudomonadota bacterium]